MILIQTHYIMKKILYFSVLFCGFEVNAMKKRVLLIVLVLVLGLTGCASQGVSITPMEVPVETARDDETGISNELYLCYAKDGHVIVANIISDSHRDDGQGIAQNPETWTEGLYILSDDGEGYTRYGISGNRSVYDAVPYDEGILCVTYAWADNASGSSDADYRWELIYHDGREEQLMDGGYTSYEALPQITLMGEAPVYISENNTAVTRSVTVRTIEDGSPRVIKDFDGYGFNDEISSNAEAYCFEIYEPHVQQPVLCAGNMDGIFFEKELEKWSNSYGVAGDRIICSLGKNLGNNTVMGISLDGGDDMTFEDTKWWFNITSEDDKICLAVDSISTIYSVDVENAEIEPLELPGGYEDQWLTKSKVIGGDSGGGYVVLVDNKELYSLQL